MKTIVLVLLLVIVVSMVVHNSPLARKGREKWEGHSVRGKSLLDDFDEERKNIDNLMR